MSNREEDVLLDVILDGIARRVANPTIIAEVTYAPENDRTTCWIRLGGNAHECIILIPNIRVRRGNKIKVRKDGNGRYEMVGGVSAEDEVSGAFPRPSTDSPFPPVVPSVGPLIDPLTGEPFAAGTEILDRRPDNEYGEGGSVEEPQGGRSDPPTPPRGPGGGGSGPLFPIDIPGGALPYAASATDIDDLTSSPGSDGSVSRGTHQHAHGDLPVVRWTAPREPHYGYARLLHNHPEITGAGGSYVREIVPVPVDATTKIFATKYDFQPGSLVVFLNGLVQQPYEDAATIAWEYQENVDLHGFTVEDDVVVDGTTVGDVEPDVLLVLYARPASAAPPPPAIPPPLPSTAMYFLAHAVAEVTETTARLTAQTSRPGLIVGMFNTDPNSLAYSLNGRRDEALFDEVLPDLLPGTTYYLRFKVYDPLNDDFVIWDTLGGTSAILSWTTGGGVPFALFNMLVVSTTLTTATLSAESNEPAIVTLFYSIDPTDVNTSAGSLSPPPPDDKEYTWELTGLTPNTRYFWRLDARDLLTNAIIYETAVFEFQTGASSGGTGAGWGQGPWGELPWGG